VRDTGVQGPPPSQCSAQGWALRDQGSASVRLAYGYAQYGYAQRKNFSLAPTPPAGRPRLISYQPSPLLLLGRDYQPGFSQEAGASAGMSHPPPLAPRAHAMRSGPVPGT
jgi:hypothetical protein